VLRISGTTAAEELAGGGVTPPRELPWGNRSFYFHDPGGNLIDFFSPSTR
jgi:catechol 2,3-dioxygenase-like lactoylglutathione lyase family enzyme